MKKKPKDYSAIKFRVSESLGEWMNCLYLKWDLQEEMKYNFIHHTDSDGASGLTKILEQESSKVPKVPLQKRILSINIFKQFFLFQKFLKLTQSINTKWKTKRRDTTGVPSSFFIVKFSQKQTKYIEEIAVRQNISTNSLLLWALDQVVSQQLLIANSPRKWICPINMRVNQQQRYGNHSSSIVLNIKETFTLTTPNDFQQKIRSFLKAQLHWGSFIYSSIPKFIGFAGARYIAKKIKEIGTGVFSNMGNWPLEEMQLSNYSKNISHRIFITPATQVLPVATGALTWQGRLALSLQLHPSLNQSEDSAQKLMKSWVDKLSPDLPPVKVQKYLWREFNECPKELIKD